MDDWEFPLKLLLFHEMAEHLVKKQDLRQRLGKYWLSIFLDRNPKLALKLTARLVRQWPYAENLAIIKDFFKKV